MFNSKYHKKGKYVVINKHKYVGDIDAIVTRSSWENQVCKWADLNPDIEYWGSEINIVKYVCPSDGGVHNYYIDITLRYRDGRVLLIEIKPKSQTTLPKQTKGKSKKTYISEMLAFQKNKSKWISANKYAEENGAKFVIWTEAKLKKLGLPIF